jgi:hypothetical protein
MTTAKKLASNRRNAQESCGPSTVSGKARAARNALRHGLSAAAPAAVDRETEMLARAIAGNACDPEVLTPARRIAEAESLAKRARTARDSLTTDFLQAVACRDNVATADAMARLAQLERYEVCALARRRFAVRDFAGSCARVAQKRLAPESSIFAKRSQKSEDNQ